MVNNQGWFNRKYPKEKANIDFDEDFQGSLLIDSYLQLKKLYLFRVNSIDKLTLKNLNQLQECTIWECGVKELIIENCLQIKKLNVRNNHLTSLNFLNSLGNLDKLNYLDIGFNNISESDLEPFRKIISLNSLNIDNSVKKKFLANKHNRFYGSLMPLEEIKQLSELNISNTDINKGLEYLPESLKKITCSSDRFIPLFRESKCSQIVKELKPYQLSNDCYSIDGWRRKQHYYLKMLESREMSEVDYENQQTKQITHIYSGTFNSQGGPMFVGEQSFDDRNNHSNQINHYSNQEKGENSKKTRNEEVLQAMKIDEEHQIELPPK